MENEISGRQLLFKELKKFLLTTFIAVILVSICFSLCVFACSIFFDTTISEVIRMATTITNDSEIAITKIFLATQTISLFGIVPLVYIIAYKKKETTAFLKIKTTRYFKYIPLIIIIMLVALPFINFIAEFNGLIIDSILGETNPLKILQEENIRISQKLLNTDSFIIVLYNVVIVALLPGFFEEFCFRGAMQNSMLSRINNHHFAIITTGIIFGLLHFEFYGVISRSMMGITFGYLLYWTNNLWFPIIAHFSNNAAIVILSYFIQKEAIDASVENIGGTNETMLIGLGSGIAVAILVFIFYTLIQKEKEIEGISS